MRKVIVFSTKSVGRTTIETDVKTWGELKKLPQLSSYNFSEFKAVIRQYNVTLDLDKAVLPTEDFVILLSPAKNKSGAGLSYKEAKQALKEYRLEAVEKEDEEMIELIGNYTQSTTEQLNEKLTAVEKLIESRKAVPQTASSVDSKVIAQLESEIEDLKQRTIVIEEKLLIINKSNEALFDSKFSEEVESIKKELNK